MLFIRIFIIPFVCICSIIIKTKMEGLQVELK